MTMIDRPLGSQIVRVRGEVPLIEANQTILSCMTERPSRYSSSSSGNMKRTCVRTGVTYVTEKSRDLSVLTLPEQGITSVMFYVVCGGSHMPRPQTT